MNPDDILYAPIGEPDDHDADYVVVDVRDNSSVDVSREAQLCQQYLNRILAEVFPAHLEQQVQQYLHQHAQAQQQLNYQLQLSPLANLSACEATAAFGKASPMLQQYNSQLNQLPSLADLSALPMQQLLHPNQCGTAQTLSGITNTASLNSIASSANLGTALPLATVASQAYGVSLGSLGNSLSELLRG